MSGEFAQRVRSAAIAGWWTVLMATLFLAGQWVAYLERLARRRRAPARITV
jgi:hypothetical protein